jgi:hypothetical protein
MKHLIIGDLHGKDCWQHIQFDNYDKVIMLTTGHFLTG